MATPAKRATIYLDPFIHKALKLKAVETSRSMSDLVNEALREAFDVPSSAIFTASRGLSLRSRAGQGES